MWRTLFAHIICGAIPFCALNCSNWGLGNKKEKWIEKKIAILKIFVLLFIYVSFFSVIYCLQCNSEFQRLKENNILKHIHLKLWITLIRTNLFICSFSIFTFGEWDGRFFFCSDTIHMCSFTHADFVGFFFFFITSSAKFCDRGLN